MEKLLTPDSQGKRQKRILVVDDEEPMRMLIRRIFQADGVVIDTAGNVDDAKRLLMDQVYDVLISDYVFKDDRTGLDLLKFVTEHDPTLPVVMITGEALSALDAVRAMKCGAFDYITKPFEREEFMMIVERAISLGEDKRELVRLRQELQSNFGFQNIVGRSKVMREVFELVQRVAHSAATILIVGESGTGKELVAKAIHHASARKTGPFLAINCGVLPENLLESELFGHEKGAFTGAYKRRKGLFEEASSGTIFLDEIGDITQSVQLKLLRVLQEKEVRPVGGNESIQVDARVICATNVPLEKAIDDGSFRQDLYYRISVVPITIPPLRERREDIPLLVRQFLRKACDVNLRGDMTLSEDAMDMLIHAPWKGNVRELENAIERAVLITDGKVIHKDAFREESMGQIPHAKAENDFESTGGGMLRSKVSSVRERIERENIYRAIKEAGGNKSKAARILGISRGSLYNKIRDLEIDI
ncbi:MAG: sigma-54 dependent transcriptional regulator [Planctomycetes bacterium]|nr:sigma-54 dependent transcriptional regulator [Planctomycetota bacterium]